METAERRGKGRNRLPPEVVEAARALVEGTKLSFRAIARRVGASPCTIWALRARHGWTRPLPPRAPRGGKGSGAPIAPEVVEAARALVEGSALSELAICKRLGMSPRTLAAWRKRLGWVRPADAPTAMPPPRKDGRPRPARYRTARGRAYAADTIGQAERLLRYTLLPEVVIADRLAVSPGWLNRLKRRRGWERPPAPPGSTRFACLTRTGPLATEGDRRGRPYAALVRREARLLWEDTLLPTALIAARAGVRPNTIASWARKEGWVRPRGRPGRPQLRGWFGALQRQAGAVRGGGAARPRVRLL